MNIYVRIKEMNNEFCCGCEHIRRAAATRYQPAEEDCDAEFNPLSDCCPRRNEIIDSVIDKLIDDKSILEAVI